MSITITYQNFKDTTKLGMTHHRSSRMKRVLSCLQAHERNRTKRNIDQLKNAMDQWATHDAKEIASRNKNDIISKLATEVIKEVLFFRQFEIASVATTPILNARTPHVVNDADTSVANQGALKASMFDQLKMTLLEDAGGRAMKQRLGTRNVQHWIDKGQAVAADPTMAIRCAESAALIIHTLRQTPRFTLPLNVIEQGIGSRDGHFWVVAGEITKPLGTPNFGPDTFAIDLWGRATLHLTQMFVGPPAKIPFNMKNNTIKVLVTWPGHF